MQRAFQLASRALVAAGLVSFALALWRPSFPSTWLLLGLALLDGSFILEIWRAFLLRLPVSTRGGTLTYDANRISYLASHVVLTIFSGGVLLVLTVFILFGFK